MKEMTRSSPYLAASLAVLWLASALVVGFAAPAEPGSGAARILYLMVPSGWVAVSALVAVFLCSAAYLGTEIHLWDQVAHAAAELGLMFSAMAGCQALLLGRATGGGWLALDARALDYALVALVAVVYLTARGRSDGDPGARRLAATVGCGGVLVAGVARAWLGGLRSIRSPGGYPSLEEVPAVAVLWLCGLALGAVFMWLLGRRVASLEGADRIDDVH